MDPRPSTDPTMSELAHVVGHDLAGRLNNTNQFLGLLRRALESGDAELVAARLDRAVAANEAARRMVSRLELFFRLHQLMGDPAPIDLDELVLEAADAFGGAPPRVVGPLPRVRGDRTTLRLAMAELLANASAWGGADAEHPTEVSAEIGSDGIAVIVADRGPGIPADRVDRALALFGQLQPRDWDRGVGMGLPIAARVVELHGGELTLRAAEPGSEAAVVLRGLSPG